MDYLLPRKSLFVYTICLLSLIPITKGDLPPFFSLDCPDPALNTTSTYAPNSTYKTNLNTLFSALSSHSSNASNGFYNFTAGTSPPDIAYGLFLCRGDISSAKCQDCVIKTTQNVVEWCPRSKRVTVWLEECMLRYSNEYIFARQDRGFLGVLHNAWNVTNKTHFNEVLGEVMDDIANRTSSDDSSKKFATAQVNYSSLVTLYGLAQCTPDISGFDCNTCLWACISTLPSCCDASQGAIVRFPSCNVRYETYPFYDASFGAAPPPPTAVLRPPRSTSTTSSPGIGGVSWQVIAAFVASIGVVVMLFIAGFCFLTKRAKKKHNSVEEDLDNVRDSLQYDLGTIEAATNNFSNDNKIGEGGFGLVYKGLLPDGQEVAVKRLSRTSGQGAQEFKNEVLLVAKLQHRNLVRLLGFCLGGEEKILIYEFVPNKSLDYFLFDPQEQEKQEKLDWSRRYKIIGGVARGMLYLHEDSRLRIIHRDLKVSNILLDVDMEPKVSDFGMARIFGNDQTHGNTRRVAGTFGYMSPEYLINGKFSTKSDVFSFGVLVLEIISGKRNNFYHSDDAANLLSYAWKLWREGTPLDLLDPTLEGSYARNEVTRCIHIALLCVQDDPNARPSMATIVLVLNSYSTSLPLPQQPRFLGRSGIGSNIIPELQPGQSMSKSIRWTVNEASISELDPR
ncbi:hypothetical protein RHMOL_Rhmol13G0210200 [Rhododendron molle]|uniref:Uncharacterized protein n=1 Tax=Rhododendron molle TaxID=49168 RepID=A0ACC0L9I1_RHOML|nr:hypothetical protein RHMOL_Rhmol13G0210200 [Rhododendron molle]